MIPGEHAEQRRLARAVAADQPDGLARLDLGRDVAQRPDVLAARAPARDDEILQRARLAGVDAEAARDAVCRDRPGAHASSFTIAALRSRRMLAHERGEPRQRVGVDRREDAVAEVEDVARTAGGAVEDVERLRLDDLPWSEQHGRIEVALHGAVGHLRPAGVERDAPVEPDHVAAGRGHLLEQRGGAGAEVDRRHVDGGEHARRVRRHVVAVVRGRERADPGVEQLDHVRARRAPWPRRRRRMSRRASRAARATRRARRA